MPKEKPKPCPLCGHKRPDFDPDRPHLQGWTITCYACGLVLHGRHRETQAELVARWNRRADKAGGSN